METAANSGDSKKPFKVSFYCEQNNIKGHRQTMRFQACIIFLPCPFWALLFSPLLFLAACCVPCFFFVLYGNWVELQDSLSKIEENLT